MDKASRTGRKILTDCRDFLSATPTLEKLLCETIMASLRTSWGCYYQPKRRRWKKHEVTISTRVAVSSTVLLLQFGCRSALIHSPLFPYTPAFPLPSLATSAVYCPLLIRHIMYAYEDKTQRAKAAMLLLSITQEVDLRGAQDSQKHMQQEV